MQPEEKQIRWMPPHKTFKMAAMHSLLDARHAMAMMEADSLQLGSRSTLVFQIFGQRPRKI